jgi:folate-dependent phosphoribosylglycinamide formyltransferase PurN
MRTVLICHHDDALNRAGIARWLASFSDLAGVVVIREEAGRMRKRIRREIQRIGFFRFLDVLAFRFYYKLKLASKDAELERRMLSDIERRYPPTNAPELITASPNSAESQKFIAERSPDMMIARCKTILSERIFTIPRIGTFVMHPGVCPEYRNAHGCFWALSRRDLNRVGMTLLRIDKGVDTGPVFGYFSYPYDERNESHIIIQHRVVFDNLDAIRAKLEEIYRGEAIPVSTAGRDSAAWGQPWLSRYLAWRRSAAANGADR